MIPVWFRFRSSLEARAGKMKRTSEPPHWDAAIYFLCKFFKVKVPIASGASQIGCIDGNFVRSAVLHVVISSQLLDF